MSGGGIEREREGAWEQGREGNFKGVSIFKNQPFTNRPLSLRLWYYKGIEREREGAWEQGREGNFKGGSIFTNQPFTNRPLPLRLWYYK